MGNIIISSDIKKGRLSMVDVLKRDKHIERKMDFNVATLKFVDTCTMTG
jgi:hypothetical protein